MVQSSGAEVLVGPGFISYEVIVPVLVTRQILIFAQCIHYTFTDVKCQTKTLSNLTSYHYQEHKSMS